MDWKLPPIEFELLKMPSMRLVISLAPSIPRDSNMPETEDTAVFMASNPSITWSIDFTMSSCEAIIPFSICARVYFTVFPDSLSKNESSSALPR